METLMLGAGGLLAGAASASSGAQRHRHLHGRPRCAGRPNCYGSRAPDLCTPNMDALAVSGVRFTQFYAAPVSPPRAPA